MEGFTCSPLGPSLADLQLRVSCRCKIKRICPFHLHEGEGGAVSPLPELQRSTPALLRVAVCVETSPKLWRSGKSKLFQLVPGEVSSGVALAAVSGCWIWPPQKYAYCSNNGGRGLGCPLTSVLCSCLSNGVNSFYLCESQ